MILDQLGAPIGKRRAIVNDEPKAKTKATGKPVNASLPHGTTDAESTVVADGSKRHFEFQEGSSNKFWEVELTGNTVTTFFGRIGTNGQSKSKEFPDASKAKAEYDKLIKEKVAKGYTEGTSITVRPRSRGHFTRGIESNVPRNSPTYLPHRTA